MKTLDYQLASHLQQRTALSLQRERSQPSADVINCCRNDYLNLRQHPKVKRALTQAVMTYGFGSGASPVVSGYHAPHAELEQLAAAFFGFERALLVNSGFHAHLALWQVLASRHHTVIADRLCHASILDGIRLSRATLKRFNHNDMAHCQQLLQQTKRPAIMVSEGVFSMEGDIAPLAELAQLAEHYDCPWVIDDAHGAGVLGKHGAGVFALMSETTMPTCLVVPLGKAFAGMGALILGSNLLLEAIGQTARAYHYSTALPPALAAALVTVLTLVQDESWRRERLNALSEFFNRRACDLLGNAFQPTITPIKSIIIGDNAKALACQRYLLEQGFGVACIRPPTVPRGSARLRISLHSGLNEATLDRLLLLIANYGQAS